MTQFINFFFFLHEIVLYLCCFFLVMQGVICSGIAYYVSGDIMRAKGPVFVTSFNPLNMVIVAVLSSFILAEQLNMGK